MAGIKARRNKLQQSEVEQNKDEFNDLFKEMQWMKKAVARELSQGDILSHTLTCTGSIGSAKTYFVIVLFRSW